MTKLLGTLPSVMKDCTPDGLAATLKSVSTCISHMNEDRYASDSLSTASFQSIFTTLSSVLPYMSTSSLVNTLNALTRFQQSGIDSALYRDCIDLAQHEVSSKLDTCTAPQLVAILSGISKLGVTCPQLLSDLLHHLDLQAPHCGSPGICSAVSSLTKIPVTDASVYTRLVEHLDPEKLTPSSISLLCAALSRAKLKNVELLQKVRVSVLQQMAQFSLHELANTAHCYSVLDQLDLTLATIFVKQLECLACDDHVVASNSRDLHKILEALEKQGVTMENVGL
eukprot:GHVQ01023350.1.p1 GENE.GHVQ01023350.1~~GHVQ01023350.1.p1  ORF type:complete len:282 (+),score=30.77 GHVQ01023350.1:545-1390(+)